MRLEEVEAEDFYVPDNHLYVCVKSLTRMSAAVPEA
jgi:hypothetical protein